MDVLSAIKERSKLTTVNITVRKYYTTVDGMLLNKAGVPDAIKKKMPVYLFNKFDIDGGFRIAANETPTLPGVFPIRFFIKSLGYDFTQFSGLNDISQNFNAGDMIWLYADDPLNPNFFIWIVQSSSNKPLGSIVSNSETLCMTGLKVFPENISDYKEDISIINANKFGDYDFNQISQQAYRYPKLINSDYVNIPLEIKLNNYVGFTTYIPFASDYINYEFEFINDTRKNKITVK